ncbi:hypothetical protein C1H46_011230 [Malus baccata]|nr:hypothetical protein C1H46_011230 [Malus baccata]
MTLELKQRIAKEEENMRLELTQRIAIKLKGSISAAHKEDKYFLLILDDVPYEQSVKDIISELKTLPGLNDMSSFKVLITRDDGDKKRTAKEEHGEIQTLHSWLHSINRWNLVVDLEPKIFLDHFLAMEQITGGASTHQI